LRDYPNLVNVFLHGSVEARAKRLMDVRHISELEAKTQIAASDKSRAQYIKKFTKKDWNDAKNYHLSIDTGEIGFDHAIDVIMKYIDSRKI
jgi:cytidylate kinase